MEATKKAITTNETAAPGPQPSNHDEMLTTNEIGAHDSLKIEPKKPEPLRKPGRK